MQVPIKVDLINAFDAPAAIPWKSLEKGEGWSLQNEDAFLETK
jgi:hypothetical protein